MMETYSCNTCGARVTELQLEKGEAVESEGRVYCARCARELGLGGVRSEAPEAHVPRQSRNMIILAGVTAGAMVLGGLIGVFFMKGEELKPRRRRALAPIPLVKPRPQTPAPVPGERPEAPARPEPSVPPPPRRTAEPEPVPVEEPKVPPRSEVPEDDAVPPPPRGTAEPAPEESVLVAGFEKEGYVLECGPAAFAERVRKGAARGEGALRAIKRGGSAGGTSAFVRVDFPAPADLNRYDKLGFWLRSSGAENELKLALITSGRPGFVIASRDAVFGKEWRWFEFLLSGGRGSVEGLVLYFNQRLDPSAYYVYLDEVRAYGKAAPLAVVPETKTEPPELPPVAGPGEKPAPRAQPRGPRPRGPRLVVADFEEGLKGAWSKYGHAIVDSPEGARGGEKGLVITVKPGDSRRSASRVMLPVAESDLSPFTHITLWLGGKGFTRLKANVEIKPKGGKHRVIGGFRYGPDWKRHVLELKDLPRSDIEAVAFYFNNTSTGWPESFEVYLDEVALHVGPPGPEEAELAMKPGLPGPPGKRRATSAEPRRDGFYMTAKVIDKLSERLKGSKAARRTLAVLGDKLAASNYFLAPLVKAGKRLDPKKGYKFIPKAALAQAARRLSYYRKRDALKKALKRYRPELVVILAGYNDLRRGLPADEAQTEYSYICECCLEAGALPVLITVPVKADARAQSWSPAQAYGGAVFRTAKTVGVPMIDAHNWLNAEGRNPPKYFRAGVLRQPAYDEINSLFVHVYDRLEKYVLPRGE